MNKFKKRRIVRAVAYGVRSIDITGEGFNPNRQNENNILVSWSNVGRYFHAGFEKSAQVIKEKDLVL